MHPRLKTTLAALAVSTAALTMSATASGTARAADGPSTAAAAMYVCLHADFGDCGMVPVTVPDAGKHTWWGSRWQDSISSLQNITTARMCFWEHNDYKGRYFVLESGYSVTNLGGTVFNDAISSWKPC
ncbi:hypothetical protein [Kitasatospora sp. NPDC008115]|uniref:hypothetical protein n=1 Tax=Kitasatospora sp. NPDC008115 TaxID=3364022 RepID=UPI0036F0FAE3